MFKCKFCGKEFEKGVSLGGHSTMCRSNPDRTNGRVVSKETRKKMSESKLEFIKINGARKQSEETKRKLSNIRKNGYQKIKINTIGHCIEICRQSRKDCLKIH